MGLEFDPAFIQEAEHRPKPTIIEADEIPVIDLSPLNSLDSLVNLPISETNDHGLAKLVAEVGNACEKWGFFQMINHGVASEKLRRIESAAREFFTLPLEEKKKRMINRWPETPADLREACQEYGNELEKLAFKLLELIALSLGVAANSLEGYFKDATTFIRLNHYPPCPSPDLALGVGRHKDAGALTILVQDEVGGLQVRRKSDGEWVSVKPTADAFIINVGDIIQVWSNGKYESVEHRVMVNSKKDRFSIPFFFNPSHYVDVKPLPELVNEENPATYKAYNWGEFFAMRKGSNFKQLTVENIQISHFKVSSS